MARSLAAALLVVGFAAERARAGEALGAGARVDQPARVLRAGGGALLDALTPSALGEESGVELGREALRSSGSLPWYDPSSDTLRPVPVEPNQQDAANRHSRWTPEERKKAASPAAGRGGGFTSTGAFGNILGWTLLTLILVALVSVLVYFFMQSDVGSEVRQREQRQISDAREAETEARLQQLPVDVRPSSSVSLLERAEGLMKLGHYNEAIIYLFSHLLVQLDRHGRIRLTRGKTNRQYLHEIGSRNHVREITGQVMLAFEDAFFGHHPLSAERFNGCWQRLDEFHRLLETGEEGHP